MAGGGLLRGRYRTVAACALACLLGACAGRAPAPEAGAAASPAEVASEARARRDADALNTQIAQSSSRLAAALGDVSREYRIGSGDALDVSVFQVPELSGTLRVNARGAVMMPLLGPVEVAGKTVAQVEQELTDRLGADYLQAPQVTVFVSEYRSAEVIVAGAVRQPAVYPITRPHTLLEILLLAGGVSDDAGFKVNVTTTVADEVSGEPQRMSLLVDLRTLMNDLELNRELLLSGGDSVFVQRAGLVYIQGAVHRAGSFKLDGEVSVLQALSLAGGIKDVADRDDIRVYRDTGEGAQVFELNFGEIRDDRASDMTLLDGDLILVGQSAFKASVAGAVRFVPLMSLFVL